MHLNEVEPTVPSKYWIS